MDYPGSIFVRAIDLSVNLWNNLSAFAVEIRSDRIGVVLYKMLADRSEGILKHFRGFR